MIYVEVVVNAPIRRSFGRGEAPTPALIPEDPAAALQTFHYHLAPELEHLVEAGHLVWVPFGRQQLQGVVVRRTPGAPVETRPILRLARPEPVLSAVQLALAEWIATTYVALFAEAVKLFLPPGLLARADGEQAVRAKHEWRVTLAVTREAARARLETSGRSTVQSEILAWLLAHSGAPPTWDELKVACRLKSREAVRALEARQAVGWADDRLQLRLPPEMAKQMLLELRGTDKYVPVVEALAGAGGLLWKSELQATAPCTLADLRWLQQMGLLELRNEMRWRDPLAGRHYPPTAAPAFTSEQAGVWAQIQSAAGEPGAAQPFLLHGVTGSGKTEIYLRAIAEAVAGGRQAVMLVPEIALTPQTVARFAGRFPDRVTVLHSNLSAGERYDVWRSLRNGRFDVVVGPRSALFAPMAKLGLIVVDEEHEATYKQDAEAWGGNSVFYDARRVAQRLAELTGSRLILGSATPSLESYYAAQQGRMKLLQMPRRVVGHSVGGDSQPNYAELPPVEIVDMRQELRAGHRSIFSRSLTGEVQRTLQAGEQAILFLNRRGTRTFVMCRDCGYVARCLRCEVPLTYHEPVGQLVCHHCNRHYPQPVVCPECGSKRIKYFGAGTERIEEAVQEIAPQARVLRWDADTASKKGAHEAIMRQFVDHEANVLIGTQMIAKGLDLPMVTLVGVVAADVGLFLPDFRSGERTFQLLTQVAGRAGRSVRGGRVVIQTYAPEHHAIQAAAQHDYLAFYQREIAFRREHAYPPVQRLARLIYWEKNLDKARAESARMAAVLRRRLQEMGVEAAATAVIGPAPAFFERIRGYYRWQILLRAPNPAGVLTGLEYPFGWRVDVDPISIL